MKRVDLAELRKTGQFNLEVLETLSWSGGGEATGSIGAMAVAHGLRLRYRTRTGDGLWHDVEEVAPFVWTSTRFGGRRQWLTCPGCGQRCRVLYGGARFRCRRCHGLCYSSQVETRSARATRAMFKIVKRLDPTAEFNDLPRKPKGMHWRTYERLAERYDAYDDLWGREVMRRFGIRR